jgi:hypothetical protein
MRRKRFRGLIISSFYVPIEEREIIDKSKELAAKEGISHSELIARALSDYLKAHYPGNPQVPLFATDPDPNYHYQVSLSFAKKHLSDILKRLEDPRIQDKSWLLKRLEEELVKCSKVYDRTKDPELCSLIHRGMELCKV